MFFTLINFIPVYRIVTSFDALKQSTGICAHLITFSSRKYIILNELSCFQSKHTFWEVREHLICLKYRCQRVYVCLHYCIQKYTTCTIQHSGFFIILRKFSHMTPTSPNEKRMRVADIVRCFCHFLL